MRRIAKGVLAIALGMNAVAFGMRLNGSNYAGNLAWDIVSAYLTLQLWIIVAAILITTTYAVTRYGFAEKSEEKVLGELPPMQSIYQIETLNLETENIQPPKEIPKAIAIKTPEPPKPLGKEELKKRVLQELTGRSDI